MRQVIFLFVSSLLRNPIWHKIRTDTVRLPYVKRQASAKLEFIE